MPFKSKAQMRMLFAAKPAVAKKMAADSQGQNNSNLPQHTNGGGGSNLAGAARRKLAKVNKSTKGNLPHPLDSSAIDKKEAQMRASQNGNN